MKTYFHWYKTLYKHLLQYFHFYDIYEYNYHNFGVNFKVLQKVMHNDCLFPCQKYPIFIYFHISNIHIHFKELRSVEIIKIKHVASTFKKTSNSDSYIFQNFRKDSCSFFALFFSYKFVFFSYLYLMMCPITPLQIPLRSNLGVFLRGFVILSPFMIFFFLCKCFLEVPPSS